MKIIIAGSRDITDYKLIEDVVYQSGWIDGETEILSGMARGVDTWLLSLPSNTTCPSMSFLRIGTYTARLLE